MIESFWSRMQVELLDRQSWRTRVELANTLSSSTSRSSITASAVTPLLACLHQLSSRLDIRPRQRPDFQKRDSTKPRAAQSLHQSQGGSESSMIGREEHAG
jgi:hypothetical protein